MLMKVNEFIAHVSPLAEDAKVLLHEEDLVKM